MEPIAKEMLFVCIFLFELVLVAGLVAALCYVILNAVEDLKVLFDRVKQGWQ